MTKSILKFLSAIISKNKDYTEKENDDILDTNYLSFFGEPLIWKRVVDFDFFYINGHNVWTDGIDIYYSEDSNHYIWDNDIWLPITWDGLDSFYGYDVWSDGNNIYYSEGKKQYILQNNIWLPITWDGLDSFYGRYVWTDGNSIYYSFIDNHYKLDKNSWDKINWDGLTNFSGNNIWTDGTTIYYSELSYQYFLDDFSWKEKKWGGLTRFSANDGIWTDGFNIYYSLGESQYKLNGTTWNPINWYNLTNFYGYDVWSDGNNIYYSNNEIQYVLNTNENYKTTWANIKEKIRKIVNPKGVSYIAGCGGRSGLHIDKAVGNIFFPMVSTRTASGGGWAIGNYNDENLQFVYGTKENIESGTNSTKLVNLRNTAGTLCLTSEAIKSISRSDTTFTATRADGTTFTFTQKDTQPNNGTLTIQKNGSNVATFTANQSGNSTANITVPTVYNALDSTSTSAALTANMGKKIRDFLLPKSVSTTAICASSNGTILSSGQMITSTGYDIPAGTYSGSSKVIKAGDYYYIKLASITLAQSQTLLNGYTIPDGSMPAIAFAAYQKGSGSINRNTIYLLRSGSTVFVLATGYTRSTSSSITLDAAVEIIGGSRVYSAANLI